MTGLGIAVVFLPRLWCSLLFVPLRWRLAGIGQRPSACPPSHGCRRPGDAGWPGGLSWRALAVRVLTARPDGGQHQAAPGRAR
jgi:hypothetical protein